MTHSSANIRLAVVAAALSAAASLPSIADQGSHPHSPNPEWRPVLQTGLTFGGDELVEVEVDYVFGGSDDEDIRAGEAFMFGGGALYERGNFQLQATINYFVDGVFGDNGNASFTRWPLELLAFYSTPKWRLGGGPTYHVNPEFELDIDYQFDEKASFDDAFGFIIQIEYRFSEKISVGARFTGIEYETEETNSVKINGDHGGLVFSLSI